MQLELLEMLDARRLAPALAYAVGSAAAGVAAVLLATNLTRRARVGP
jgi:fluoride ion exporter CrcB/FEX